MQLYSLTALAALTLFLSSSANLAQANTKVGQESESIIIPIAESELPSSAPQATFTVPMKSSVQIDLSTSKNTKPDSNVAARISISDQNCQTGHQVSISYEKTATKTFIAYFPKEIPWGSTYKLSISHGSTSKEVIVIINDQSVSFFPRKSPRYIRLTPKSDGLNLVNMESHN